jgi:hypothetical protein
MVRVVPAMAPGGRVEKTKEVRTTVERTISVT